MKVPTTWVRLEPGHFTLSQFGLEVWKCPDGTYTLTKNGGVVLSGVTFDEAVARGNEESIDSGPKYAAQADCCSTRESN